MAISEFAKTVIERPLPKDKIKQRPGKAGMTYDYVTPDFVIDLLNEAFEYRWSTAIFYQDMHGDTAVVGVCLSVWDADNNRIDKSQFGSCEVSRGMGPGEAFKGAASDGMKKAATLLGVALELYQEDEAPKPAVMPRTPTSPSAPSRPAPPRPVAGAPVAPPAPRPAPPAPTAAAPAPVRKSNPFTNGNATAAVPKPAAPAPAPVPAPPRPISVAAPAPKVNPFASRATGAGPNSTQLNALTNLSQKKGLSQSDMIALAGIVDETGNPKLSFDDLSHAEAIQVIKASQL